VCWTRQVLSGKENSAWIKIVTMETIPSNERAAIKVARNIVTDIQKRALRPGTKLDPEHVMVEKFGVARASGNPANQSRPRRWSRC
jgi:hypothetical protein